MMRYARQLNLEGWGNQGQQQLATARVLIIGMGGLGNSCGQSLVAAGIGALTINDFDSIDETNLPRQHLFRQSDIGTSKVFIAAERLKDLNPHCYIDALDKKLASAELAAAVQKHNIVIDASDNFVSRFAINKACRQQKVTLVSGAATGWHGMVGYFSQTPHSACYQCLFPDLDAPFDDCESAGVAPQLVGVIGNLMANAALSYLIAPNAKHQASSLTRCDLNSQEWKHSAVLADPQCSICSTN